MQLLDTDFSNATQRLAWTIAREKLAEVLLLAIGIICIPALPISLSRIIETDWIPEMGAHVILAAGSWSMALFRKRLPYHLKAGWCLFFFGFLALAALYSFAISGTSMLLLGGMVFFALMLYGVRAATAAMLIAAAIAALFKWMHVVGILTPPVDLGIYMNSYSSALIPIVSFLGVFISGILGASFLLRLVNEMSATAEQTESRFHFLAVGVDQMNETFAVFDAEDRLRYFNKAFQQRITILSSEIREGMSYLDYVTAVGKSGMITDANSNLDEWIAASVKEHQNPTGPYEVSRFDGRTILVNQQRFPDGSSIFSTSDITELQEARQEATHAGKLASLGEMAAGVAHELNQPLNVINLATNSLLMRSAVQEVPPDVLTEKLETIQGQVERASKTINQMRRFSRKPQNTTELFKPIDASHAALDMLREQLRGENIALTETYLGESCEVLGEQMQLEQVVLNLLRNARDAIVETEAEYRAIEVSLSSSETDVKITVTDSGGGIPQTVLPKLFQPFFTTKPAEKGTGIGLSLSHKIVGQMGGTLTAHNTSEGACFTITLPLAA